MTKKFFEVLLSINATITPKDGFTVCDVGALGGIHPLFSPIQNASTLIAFEPNTESNNHFGSKENWKNTIFSEKGLWSNEDKIPLYDVSAPTNTSVFKPNNEIVTRYKMEEKWTVLGENIIEVMALDEFCRLEKIQIDFLKLDTQGSEFEILLGSKEQLENNITGVITEVSFFEIYKEQKLFHSICRELENRGFSFYGFDTTFFRSSGAIDRRKLFSKERMMYADAIFIKDPFENTKMSKNEIFKSSVFLFLAGYIDAGIEFLSKFVFTPNETIQLKKMVAENFNLAQTSEGKEALKALSELRISNESDFVFISELRQKLGLIGDLSKFHGK